MDQTPQENDSPKEHPDSDKRINPSLKNQETKESAKKIVFKADDEALSLENLPTEASELMKNIMSADSVMRSTLPGNKNEDKLMELLNVEQNQPKEPQMDQQAQDLLKLMMVMQQKVSEKDLQRVTDPDPVIMETDLRHNSPNPEQLPKMPPPPPPPPPPPVSETTSPGGRPVFRNTENDVFPEKNLIFEKKDFIIDEKGSIFGIQINKTRRKEVVEIMKSISKVNNTGKFVEAVLKYDDVGINFHFGEGGILDEITFNYPFEGATFKGLQIFDNINKAISLYGQPNILTQAGAMWQNIAIFLKDDTVTTIRLRSK